VSGILEQILDEVRALRAELAELKSRPSATEISVGEYAARHSLSPSTVRGYIRDGRLPAKRVGRLLRIPANATIGTPVTATISKPETSKDRAKTILGIVRGGGQ
jgi:excisionase family DNA binding protein